MKSIVALCLLVVLCTGIPLLDDLESLRRQVRDVKYTVESHIHRLERLRYHIEEDTEREVDDVLHKHENNYRDYKDTFLRDIRIKVNDAKDKGKEVTKVDNCYNIVVEGLNSAEKTAKDDSIKCVNSSQVSIKKNLVIVDYLIETGYILISQLDDIFLKCHDIDDFKKISCIMTELNVINAQVRIFEDDIISTEMAVVPIKDNVVKQADNCIDNAYSPIQAEGDRLKIAAQKCIDSL